MSDIVRRDDCLKVIDRFRGYLDEDMIGRIKIALQRDVPKANDVNPIKEGVWVKEDGFSPYNFDNRTTIYRCGCGYTQGYKTKYCPSCGASMI